MIYKGRIQKVLPMRSGTSAKTGNEWKSLPFVFEYFEDERSRYADRALLECFNEEQMKQIREGAEATVGFGHDVRYGNDGHAYNSLRLYRIEVQAPKPTIGVNWEEMGGATSAFPTAKAGETGQGGTEKVQEAQPGETGQVQEAQPVVSGTNVTNTSDLSENIDDGLPF